MKHMTVIFSGETFLCEKAVKNNDSAILHLSEGGTVTFSGVHNWDAFSISDGEWSDPDVTPDEQLRADVDFLAIMTGVSL